MKVLVIVTLAAAAVGQQFQQQRQYDTAVRLATPGYFTQGGSFTSASFQNANGRLQGDSFQNSFQTATSDANTFRQSGLFQNSNQLQRNAATNRNQFQTGSFQQNSFDSNAFQQNTSPFQQNSNAQSANASSSQVPVSLVPTTDSRPTPIRLIPEADSSPPTNRTTLSRPSTTKGTLLPHSPHSTTNRTLVVSSSNVPLVVSSQALISRIPTTNSSLVSTTRIPTINSSPPSTTRIPMIDSSPLQQPEFQQPIPVHFNQNSNNRFQSTFNNQDSNRFSQNSQTSSFLQSSSDSVSGVFEPLNLPSGASALLGGITSAFSCLDRPYGYYADQDNSCRVFHVCNPTLFSNGAVETYQYSFMCGEGSVFDQKELTCVAESSAIPCQESSNYFYTNEQFGRPEDKSF
ncbi:putative fibrous sheath CABYR-binding protein [Penaeus vannamei]|uniref:Putative fibrous sheath CABYR-binding protein n=1 Tax=Penaeus vannamei TaxID=6689 RepID=A0A3R7SNP3_PENVA|nr:putative fibrous sheath CABYR-binding protein [Penaeus vannamei]